MQGLVGTQTYCVTITDAGLCTASACVVVTQTNNTPTVTITPTTSPEWCAGSGGSATLTANGSGGSGTLTYSWNGTFISPTNTPVVTVNPNAAGIYTYTVTVTDTFNCTATATRNVIVDTLPTVSAGPPTFVVCNGQSVTIGGSPTASGFGPFTYNWGTGVAAVANPSVSPLIPTTYIVVVTDGHGCSASASTNVNVLASPIASAGLNQTFTGCSRDTITIGGAPTASGGTGPYTNAWAPPLDLSSTTVANPKVIGLGVSRTYTVTVTDANSCSASSSVTLTITVGHS